MLNFAKIGSDAGLPAATVREHYFLTKATRRVRCMPWQRFLDELWADELL